MLTILQFVDANFDLILRFVSVVSGVLAISVIGVMMMELFVTQ